MQYQTHLIHSIISFNSFKKVRMLHFTLKLYIIGYETHTKHMYVNEYN